jgi:hypothetical protein
VSREQGRSGNFFLHFYFFLFRSEPLKAGKAECSLLIEERRKKPRGILVSGGFGFRLDGWPNF